MSLRERMSGQVGVLDWAPTEQIPPRVVDGFSGHVDVRPTLPCLAGFPMPTSVEGVDLTPMLAGEPLAGDGVRDSGESVVPDRTHPILLDTVQDGVLIEIRGNVSVVTNCWKMGLYPHDTEGDSYDLVDDPFELINR